ncbi:hypothetical protein LCGC14_3166480, partial [marine sediment metagenome]
MDWSARGTPSPAKPAADAIWIAVAGEEGCETRYFRTRTEAMRWLGAELEAARDAGRRVLVGVDFPLGYPAGFARAVRGDADPLKLWDWLGDRISDA